MRVRINGLTFDQEILADLFTQLSYLSSFLSQFKLNRIVFEI